MATIGRKANLWFQSFDYKRSGCPSCDSGEDPSPMLRLCCEHLVDETGESTTPQAWSIKYPCSTGLKRKWGSADAVCTDKDFETVLDSGLVTLWKDCVVGCTWSARRKTLGGLPDNPITGLDTTDPCCAAKWYATPVIGGGQTDTVAVGYWGTDSIYDNPNCRPWVLEVTSPTTATLTYTYRDGTSVTYVPVRSPWQPLDNPQEWVVTPETVANRGVLPCALCVVPSTDPGFGPRPCRKTTDTCACCDDYECEGNATIFLECPDEDLTYSGTLTRYQWEDDEGDPNILDCDSPFRLPTINPFGSFPAAFADFPATYANAPCGVFYGTIGVFQYMSACIGEGIYHLRIVCPDLDTGEATVIYDGQPTFTCNCRGFSLEFSFGEQNCVECPGEDPPIETECCENAISRIITVEIEPFGTGCDCFAPTTGSLTYDEANEWWQGTVSTGTYSMVLRVKCVGTNLEARMMSTTCPGYVTTEDGLFLTNFESCDPLLGVDLESFFSITLNDSCACPGNPDCGIQITFTEG